MRAYVMTTGIVFAMLVLAHVWRVVLEGWHIAMSPIFALTTIAAAALVSWSWRVLRHANADITP